MPSISRVQLWIAVLFLIMSQEAIWGFTNGGVKKKVPYRRPQHLDPNAKSCFWSKRLSSSLGGPRGKWWPCHVAKAALGLQFNPGSSICELTLGSPFNSAPPGVKQGFSARLCWSPKLRTGQGRKHTGPEWQARGIPRVGKVRSALWSQRSRGALIR